ncbi:hypothetical protein IQ254_01115 [Nodosilinea sp. LEGE 07088]|uniref:hypothetical protein n=1 Tax=Nodosilinea sp. LEGE 07088 TaxID=2777968 RepID=UPI0018806B16|nr:hypothetical protein [Nodosilinea sp. LEGE 07088]MBE9135817.1 hypothetical protein [Nodosilinea sp. LEGE 07088]
MNPSAQQGDQLGPLNPGDVVSAALRLYKDKFKPYFQLAVLATLWLLAGVVGMAIAIAILVVIGLAIGGDVGAIVGGLLGLLVGFAPLLYGSAKYYALSSAIGRLSFRELINQPETSLEARRQVAPRLGQFLFLGFLLMLAYMAAYLVAVLAALIGGGSVGFLTAGIFSALINGSVGAVIGISLGALLGLGILLVVLIWVASRLFIAEVVLAIESQQDAGTSMSRSWELTQSAIMRIQVVFLATFLIQLPILSVTNYIPSIMLELLPDDTVLYSITALLSLILSLFGSMVVLPLWQAVKGVLYYDLRSRREGLDLALRQGDEGMPAADLDL